MADPPADVGPARWWRATLGIVMVGLVIAVIAVGVLMLSGDRDDGPAPGTTTSVTGSTTSSSPQAAADSAGALSELESAAVLWPEPGAGAFGDAVALAETFAIELIGFDDPLVEEFEPGGFEGRFASGAVEVSAERGGPTTLVLVRQMSDDAWYVVGAVAEDFELAEPDSGATVEDGRVEVSSVAPGLDGPLIVTIRERSDSEPIGEAIVAVDEEQSGVETFDRDVSFDDPGDGFGSVVVVTLDRTGETVEQAAAVPIRFGRG